MFEPLARTEVEFEESYTEGYGDGNDNGYTEGWYDSRELAEKEQAVLEARIELLEFQLSAMVA